MNKENFMNITSYVLILCIFIGSANQVFSLSYKDINPSSIQYDNVTSQDIQEAKLLESHIVRYAENINTQAQSLGIGDVKIISESYNSLFIMKNLLIGIQNKNVNGNITQDVMKDIVGDLKKINTQLKIYFANQELKAQQKLKEQKEKYTIFTVRLGNALNNFINKISGNLLEKENLSKSEKDIVRKLVDLREENYKLLAFSEQIFGSDAEMKSYLKTRIENIRKFMLKIQSLSRQY